MVFDLQKKSGQEHRFKDKKDYVFKGKNDYGLSFWRNEIWKNEPR